MPATAHFRRLIAGSTGQRKSILRNLVSSLIIHESITTTLSKAKAVQPYAEKVITMGKKYAGRKDQRDRASAYLYDWKETMPKLFDTLASRYSNRSGGYTRIHKIPPRYGDMAPQAILELVDGKRDMLFSMTARRVARSKILGTKWLSESTRDAMYRIFQFRGENGVKEFDEEVERQKALLMAEDKRFENWQKKKEEKTIQQLEDRVDERAMYTTSRHNRRKLRELEARDNEKRRANAYVSEDDKDAELKMLTNQATAERERKEKERERLKEQKKEKQITDN